MTPDKSDKDRPPTYTLLEQILDTVERIDDHVDTILDRLEEYTDELRYASWERTGYEPDRYSC